MFNDWLKFVGCCLVAVVLLCGGRQCYLIYGDRVRQRGHTKNYAYNDLRSIMDGIEIMYEVERKKMWEIQGGNRTLTGTEIFKQLAQSPDDLAMSRPSEESVSRSSFCDRWGKEIHGRISLHGDQMHVVLWSNGPNIRDENGKGDDIVMELDMAISEATPR